MLGAALVAGFLYWLLRQMERWLQQHIFKVGWLLTKDFRTTTVLYYVFFLPGVLLHELSLWLAAGILNVRADRAAQFPAPQEIPELRLNFVRVSPRAPKWKLAIIEFAPPAAGLAVVALIANSVLDITPALSVMRTGDINDVGTGFGMLTSIPDFWLWAYILLAVANTMSPKITARDTLLRPLLVIIAAVGVVLFALGLAEDALTAVTSGLSQLFNVLAAVFGIVVFINAAAIFFLAVIENTIEWFTGDSATIDKHGKLVAKKRAEILAERQQERQRAAKAREEEKARVQGATEGIPSIYRLPLPLPDTGEPDKRVIMPPPPPAPAINPPRLDEPDIIEIPNVDDDEADEIEDDVAGDEPDEVSPPRPSPALPPPRPTTPVSPRNELDSMSSAFGDDDDDESFDDEDEDIEPI